MLYFYINLKIFAIYLPQLLYVGGCDYMEDGFFPWQKEITISFVNIFLIMLKITETLTL